MAEESIVEVGGGLVKKGAFTDSGNRKSMAAGMAVGALSVWQDRYELVLMMLGIIIGEEASVGEGVLPSELIDSSPIYALVGLSVGMGAVYSMKVWGVL